MVSHAIHIHDLLTCLLGPVASIYARLDTRVNAIETEDCAALSIIMQSGALVTSSVTLGAGGDHSRLRMMFDTVTVESDHAPYAPAALPWTFTPRTQAAKDQIAQITTLTEPVPVGFAGFFDAVADALDEKTNIAVSLEDGRRSIEFITAVYASARSGQAIELPLTCEHPLYHGWAPGPQSI